MGLATDRGPQLVAAGRAGPVEPSLADAPQRGQVSARSAGMVTGGACHTQPVKAGVAATALAAAAVVVGAAVVGGVDVVVVGG